MLRLLLCVTLTITVLTVTCQIPSPLWKWPQSSSSYLNTSVPGSSSNAEYNGISSCGGGGDTRISWSCPHMMLLSPDMQYAALTDNIPWALYGVVGIGQPSDCGKCYQLQLNSFGDLSPRTYIVQAVNTGSDVSSGQFDVLVGAGGFGIYNGCASDCKYGQTCSGGHCNYPQYSGNFQAWTPDGNCYGGGVHDPNGCNRLVTTPSGQQSFAEKTLIYGCQSAIQEGYHQNFKVNFKRVACPRSLYQVTGIKSKNDESLLDEPSPFLELDGTGQATTTMDCCKPTCAWRQSIGQYTQADFPSVYVCGKNGYPLTN